MNLLILPLLVVSQLDLKNETWKNGAEVIYNVTFNVEAKPSIQSPVFDAQIKSANFTNQLKCRSKSENVLNCYLSEPKGYITYQNSSDIFSKPFSDTPFRKNVDNGKHLDIKFDENGINELVVPSSIRPVELDVIRYIVNQLHTGINLIGRSEGIYKLFENSTIGDCQTTFELKFSDNKDLHDKKEKLRYTTAWSPETKAIISKERDLKKCRYLVPYFLPSQEAWREKPKFIIDMMSSKSKIVADKLTFVSSTETTLRVEHLADPVNNIPFKMHENITVQFDSVKPADDQFYLIEEPSSTGTIAGKWLYEEKSP